MLKSSLYKSAAEFVLLVLLAPAAFAFEGRITAVKTEGGQRETLLYTADSHHLRLEISGEAGLSSPRDLFDLPSGALTILFPHNHTLLHVPGAASTSATQNKLAPAIPPVATSPAPLVSAPGAPAFPVAPPVAPVTASQPGPQKAAQKIELTATGQSTNLLGYDCARYEIKQHGATMEIWATGQLLPFHAYTRHQPPGAAPRILETEWAEVLTAKKLFPLLAILRFEGGAETLRYEVKSIQPEKLDADTLELLKTPADYHEIQPLPF